MDLKAYSVMHIEKEIEVAVKDKDKEETKKIKADFYFNFPLGTNLQHWFDALNDGIKEIVEISKKNEEQQKQEKAVKE